MVSRLFSDFNIVFPPSTHLLIHSFPYSSLKIIDSRSNNLKASVIKKNARKKLSDKVIIRKVGFISNRKILFKSRDIFMIGIKALTILGSIPGRNDTIAGNITIIVRGCI